MKPQAWPNGLYLVATPIGNLADMSARALEALRQADEIWCEDTRVTRKLMQHYGINTRLQSYLDHHAERLVPRILEHLALGKKVALVSDAGTPLISDPGFDLVREAANAGHRVIPIPGASSVIAALAASGLPTQPSTFLGFLPPRSTAIKALMAQWAQVPTTLILFESPKRLTKTLPLLAEILGDRPAVVARELTKMHEEFTRGTLAQLAEEFSGREEIRGEIVLLIGPPEATQATSEQDWQEMLREALKKSSVRDAVAQVSETCGIARKIVYAKALQWQS